MIRERVACGLAPSGMLSEKQRHQAVPRLLDFTNDYSLDPETQKWVYQVLRHRAELAARSHGLEKHQRWTLAPSDSRPRLARRTA
jgi:hypothetical protein